MIAGLSQDVVFDELDALAQALRQAPQ